MIHNSLAGTDSWLDGSYYMTTDPQDWRCLVIRQVVVVAAGLVSSALTVCSPENRVISAFKKWCFKESAPHIYLPMYFTSTRGIS